MTVISKGKEEPLKINGVVYTIIGLAAISVLLIIVYLCTHMLEKCIVQDLLSFAYLMWFDLFRNPLGYILLREY